MLPSLPVDELWFVNCHVKVPKTAKNGYILCSTIDSVGPSSRLWQIFIWQITTIFSLSKNISIYTDILYPYNRTQYIDISDISIYCVAIRRWIAIYELPCESIQTSNNGYILCSTIDLVGPSDQLWHKFIWQHYNIFFPWTRWEIFLKY